MDMNQLGLTNTSRRPTSLDYHNPSYGIKTAPITSTNATISDEAENNSSVPSTSTSVTSNLSEDVPSNEIRAEVSCVPVVQTNIGNYLTRKVNTGQKRMVDRSLLCLQIITNLSASLRTQDLGNLFRTKCSSTK